MMWLETKYVGYYRMVSIKMKAVYCSEERVVFLVYARFLEELCWIYMFVALQDSCHLSQLTFVIRNTSLIRLILIFII